MQEDSNISAKEITRAHRLIDHIAEGRISDETIEALKKVINRTLEFIKLEAPEGDTRTYEERLRVKIADAVEDEREASLFNLRPDNYTYIVTEFRKYMLNPELSPFQK